MCIWGSQGQNMPNSAHFNMKCSRINPMLIQGAWHLESNQYYMHPIQKSILWPVQHKWVCILDVEKQGGLSVTISHTNPLFRKEHFQLRQKNPREDLVFLFDGLSGGTLFPVHQHNASRFRFSWSFLFPAIPLSSALHPACNRSPLPTLFLLSTSPHGQKLNVNPQASHLLRIIFFWMIYT